MHETDLQRERRLGREAQAILATLGEGVNTVIVQVTYWDEYDYERAGQFLIRCDGNPYKESERIVNDYFGDLDLNYQIEDMHSW